MIKRKTTRIDVDGRCIEEDIEVDSVEEKGNTAAEHLRERAMNEKASAAALADPELMRLWGEINFIWDEIENMLWLAFDAMLEANASSTRAIFFSQKSHAARRNMVEELSKQYFNFQNNKHQGALRTALKRVKARSDTRNILAHGVWGWKTDGAALTMEVVRIASEPHMSPTPILYNKNDLQQARDSMSDTMKDLAKAVNPLIISKYNSFSARLRFGMHTSDTRFEGVHPMTWPWPID